MLHAFPCRGVPGFSVMPWTLRGSLTVLTCLFRVASTAWRQQNRTVAGTGIVDASSQPAGAGLRGRGFVGRFRLELALSVRPIKVPAAALAAEQIIHILGLRACPGQGVQDAVMLGRGYITVTSRQPNNPGGAENCPLPTRSYLLNSSSGLDLIMSSISKLLVSRLGPTSTR